MQIRYHHFLWGVAFVLLQEHSTNCSKLWIEPSRSWLNQFRAHLVKVVVNSLQVNPLVISSSKVFWEMGDWIRFALEFFEHRQVKALWLHFSHYPLSKRWLFEIPLIAFFALSIGLFVGILPTLRITSLIIFPFNSIRLITISFSFSFLLELFLSLCWLVFVLLLTVFKLEAAKLSGLLVLLSTIFISFSSFVFLLWMTEFLSVFDYLDLPSFSFRTLFSFSKAWSFSSNILFISIIISVVALFFSS